MSILKRSCIEIIISFYTHSLGNIRPFKKSQVCVGDSYVLFFIFTLSALFSCLMCFSSKIPFGKCVEIPGNLNTKDTPSFEVRQAKPNREIKFADRLAYYILVLVFDRVEEKPGLRCFRSGVA